MKIKCFNSPKSLSEEDSLNLTSRQYHMTNKTVYIDGGLMMSHGLSKKKKKKRRSKPMRSSTGGVNRYLTNPFSPKANLSLPAEVLEDATIKATRTVVEPISLTKLEKVNFTPSMTSENTDVSQQYDGYQSPTDEGLLKGPQSKLECIDPVVVNSIKSSKITGNFSRFKYHSKRLLKYSYKNNKSAVINIADDATIANTGEENVIVIPELNHINMYTHSPIKRSDMKNKIFKSTNSIVDSTSTNSIVDSTSTNSIVDSTSTNSIVDSTSTNTYTIVDSTSVNLGKENICDEVSKTVQTRIHKYPLIDAEISIDNLKGLPVDIIETNFEDEEKVRNESMYIKDSVLALQLEEVGENLISFEPKQINIYASDTPVESDESIVPDLCESPKINDKSKEIDAKFNSLYNNIVSKHDASNKSHVATSSHLGGRHSYIENDYKSSSQDPLLASDKVLETHFNSLYAEAVIEREAFNNNVDQYNSLLDKSTFRRSLSWENLKSHRLVDYNHVSRTKLIDFNTAEISCCSTQKETRLSLSPVSSRANNSPEIDEPTEVSIAKLNLAPIANSTRQVDHLQKLEPVVVSADTCAPAKYDFQYHDILELDSNADAVLDGDTSSDNSPRSTEYVSSRQTLLLSSPKALQPERFSMFGSPIQRTNSFTQRYIEHLSGSKYSNCSQVASVKKEPSTIRNLSMNASQRNRTNADRTNRRPKNRYNLHPRNSRGLATISEDQMGIGPDFIKYEHLFKILVVGNLSTGKTSIIKQYVHHFFSEHYRATVGVDFALKVLNWDENTTIRLQLWDIAGQERYSGGMTRVYYKEAVGALVVFDATEAPSMDAAIRWKKDIDDKVTLPNGNPIPTVLLANKCDKANAFYARNYVQMRDVCRHAGFCTWYATSAKENRNLEEAVEFLVNKILKLAKDNNFANESVDSEIISVRSQDPKKNRIRKKICSC